MKKGILLPIFSLPSEYGIGDFGKEAYEFIDILKENLIDYWEILPINESNKLPYSPISFYALNIDYISIDKLIEIGLVKSAEKKPKSSRIKYDYFKEKYYKEAFNNFEENEEFIKFCENDRLIEYAKFMSIHENENMPEKYYLFLQYILDLQWNNLKNYANNNGIKIIGDMPIYPDFDSAEVKFHSSDFDLENGNLKFVSGAPPDNCNSEGQKWGHPLYNFDYMKKDNYKYLISKFKEYFKRFDLVRVDHFIAFDTYYKIPINESPKNGYYAPGPSYSFFDELFKTESPDRIIVEDLGNIRQETEKLKDRYNFLGNKILHYSIDLVKKQDTLLDARRVVYTSNHDNNTTCGWYKRMKLIDKLRLKKFFKINGIKEKKVNVALIKYALSTNAEILIVPVQDIIGLGEEARINLPGVDNVENWSWELLDFDLLKKDINVLNYKLPIKKKNK